MSLHATKDELHISITTITSLFFIYLRDDERHCYISIKVDGGHQTYVHTPKILY